MQNTETKRAHEESTSCRRRRRAHTAPMAVGYQLLNLVEEQTLRAIVIADDVGIPLAYAGDPALSALLAESAMWAEFAMTSVDDVTLPRIQHVYPDIESHHVAAQSIGRDGVQVLAVGTEEAPREAVSHAREGIARICGDANVGPEFLDAESCESGPVPAPVVEREHGVRWLIGGLS